MLVDCGQAEDKRKVSICESVASTISVEHPSEEELSSDDDDNGEDNGDDTSDTASAPSPRPPTMPTPPPAAPSTVEPSIRRSLPGGGRLEQQRTLAGFVPASLAAMHQQRVHEGGYDSAATLSADEGPGAGDGLHAQLSPHLRHPAVPHPPPPAPPSSQHASGSDRPQSACAPDQRPDVSHSGSRPSSTQPFQSYTAPQHER